MAGRRRAEGPEWGRTRRARRRREEDSGRRRFTVVEGRMGRRPVLFRGQRRRPRPHDLEVHAAVDDLAEHAEEVALSEDDVAGGAAEALHVEEAVPRLHD